MHTTFVISVLLICECLTIRVPVVWDNGVTSEVQNENQNQKDDFSVVEFQPKDNSRPQIPTEYFEYTAKKPQFAIDIAKQHGVQNPAEHFRAQPVRPYTGTKQPQLGIHHMLDEDKNIFKPYQQYVKSESLRHIKPVSSNYEVFHPYKAEEPLLQAIYKDPMLAKIRNNLENSQLLLRNQEEEAGESDITKDDYVESEKQTDKRLFPHKNVPAQFEIHRPERRPAYYKAPAKLISRDQDLNQRFRHPWNQNYVKIRPIHYRPLQNHIQNLRQHQALKYDDEKNEYPQVQIAQDYNEPQEGYDIYEKGKDKYEELRDNVDESINKAVLENRPQIYQKLELQNNESEEENNEEDEYIPVKNYAQVRKTETYKHLPREAAFADAETYDEIRNAPRLREAVKSSKAQTVYTEEGYEDGAYDHAGELKHASDHEAHGGYLKEKEKSEGKYKIPSVSGHFDDEEGSEYRDQIIHGKKWKNDNKDHEAENESENYSEVEHEQSVETDAFVDRTDSKNSHRSKRDHHDHNFNNENKPVENTKAGSADKGEINIEVPELDLNTTFLTEEEILRIAKIKIEPERHEESKEKYPYYFKNIKAISKHSPLKYAENMKFIPKKSKGGTEFYDSRSALECSDVDDVDPVPEKLKKGENPTESEEVDTEENKSTKGEKNFDTINKQPRLKGLGDKIDCFKAKYFGENPLDSPFFKEEIIDNPEPVTVPNLPTYKLKESKEISALGSMNIIHLSDKQNEKDLFALLDKLRNTDDRFEAPIYTVNQLLTTQLPPNITTSNNKTLLDHQSSVYADVIDNIYNNNLRNTSELDLSNSSDTSYNEASNTQNNIKYKSYNNKEDVTVQPLQIRRKRAATFVYEPYKIIRDSQVQDSKKTTTTSNVSPLIKQLQSSRVVDKVSKDKENDKPVSNKMYISSRTYKDIGKNDRQKSVLKEDSTEPSFIDVNVDQRRGEPRYEIRPANHKSEYTPVETKKSITLEDYKSKTTANNTFEGTNKESREERSTQPKTKQNTSQRRPTVKPVFDVTQFLPTTLITESLAASNNVRRFISTTTHLPPKGRKDNLTRKSNEESGSDEEYDEYEDDEITTTSTTTTSKPKLRRRSRGTTTTTEEPRTTTTEVPKLRLVTRFRDYNLHNQPDTQVVQTEKPKLRKEIEAELSSPRYREKKKKTTKSTLVTDTKKYGDDEDDDAMIGIKHDIDDYIPTYEKDSKEISDDSSEESDEEDDEETDSSEEEEDEVTETTTSEPTKRTLLKTTEAPVPTFPSRSAKLENKPIVSRKKIEIHKELPVNKSSPHVTQFKQDIEEEEIVKEMPQRKKTQKNTEALELYKDDSLPKEINKLDDVEVFKEDLDLINGPKHGGNYRSIEEVERTTESSPAKDALASQSENTKQLETYSPRRMHGGNLKSISDLQRSRSRGPNAKYTEIRHTETKPRAMHGGNLRYDSKPRRGNTRSQKLIELDDKNDDKSKEHDDNYKTYGSRTSNGPMHGGNYRSAKILADDDIEVRKTSRDASKTGAELLNSFAQAVPVLTTTPGYILDPSKRMYYYVEA